MYAYVYMWNVPITLYILICVFCSLVRKLIQFLTP